MLTPFWAKKIRPLELLIYIYLTMDLKRLHKFNFKFEIFSNFKNKNNFREEKNEK